MTAAHDQMMTLHLQQHVEEHEPREQDLQRVGDASSSLLVPQVAGITQTVTAMLPFWMTLRALGIALSVLSPVAGLTGASPPVPVGVLLIVGMTLRAVRRLSLNFAGHSASDVLGVTHRFEMTWPDAPVIPAEVVDVQAVRYRAAHQNVRRAVRKYLAATARHYRAVAVAAY